MNERPDDLTPISETELWRYVDHELSPDERAALRRRLGESPAERERLEDFERDARLCGDALCGAPFDDTFVDRFRERLQGYRLERALAVRRRRYRLVALAALVLLFPLLTFAILQLSAPKVEQLGAYRALAEWAVVRVEGGRGFNTVSGAEAFPLRPGLRFDVPEEGELELRLRRETGETSAELVVKGPAVLAVASEARPGRFHGVLELGEVEADVEPLRPGEVFGIETPDAAVEVVGTRFVVRVSDGETRIGVTEGRVRVTSERAVDDAPLVASPGEWVRVRALLGSIPEPVAAGAPPYPPGPEGAARRDSSRETVEGAAPESGPDVTGDADRSPEDAGALEEAGSVSPESEPEPSSDLDLPPSGRAADPGAGPQGENDDLRGPRFPDAGNLDSPVNSRSRPPNDR